MTEQPDPKNNQPADPYGHTTNDLRKAAQQARELFEAAHGADEREEPPLEVIGEEAQDPDMQTSVLPLPPEPPEDIGNTTNDLAQEAYRALQLDQEAARLAEQTRQSDTFDPAVMKLELLVTELHQTLLKAVDHELVVGRADSVTDYMPDIDMTPYGAYRLGLSRKHAIISVEGEALIVKDLNSRNGTFVNGKAIPTGGTHPLRDGDSVRFGNLTVKVRFQREGE